jgi:hypothetical protein
MILVHEHYFFYVLIFHLVSKHQQPPHVVYLLIAIAGSDPAIFFLARPGFYRYEPGQRFIILLFKRKDLHSGFTTSIDEGSRIEHLRTVDAAEHEFFGSIG